MASKSLALSNPELIAEYVPQSQLGGFFEKRLAAPPDHMAMLIRDGQIVDTYKGAHFSVGGILKGIKSLIVGTSHVSILLADLKPFSLRTTFKAISKDHVQIFGEATFELQVDPDKPKNVMGLVNSCGYLTQDEILERFKPHLTDRVLEAAISKVNADEIRGDRGLQDHIQAEIMREIERVAGDLGLIVRATSFEWALNDVEKERMQKSVLDRNQEKLDQELDYLKRNMQRSRDSISFQIESDLGIAKLETSSEEELEHLVLNRQVRLVDARALVDRRHELEALSHQIGVLKNRRVARFETELKEGSHQFDLAQQQRRLRQIQLEIDRLDRVHQMELKRLEADNELEIDKRRQLGQVDIQRESQRQQIEHLRALQELEQEGEDAEARRTHQQQQLEADVEMQKAKSASDARVAEMQAGSIMTAEQIMAVNASHSSDVANVLVEQARASAANNEEVKSTMQKLVEQANSDKNASAQQAKDLFQMAMQGVQGVAQGIGPQGHSGQNGTGQNETDSKQIECSKCGRANASTYRFCIGCGNKLRV